MIVKLYWMGGCTHCEKIKKELSKLPRKYPKPIQIENKNISHEEREELHAFPTLNFYSDDKRLLKTMIGYHTLEEINNVYDKVEKLEYLQKKYKNLEDRNK